MPCSVNIEYSNPFNHSDNLILSYKLLDNPVVPLWCERLTTAQEKYKIDSPNRFYGFGTLQDQIEYAILTINNIIDTINNFRFLIDRKLSSVYDQDTLNYLHHCFEIHHGLLDKQDDTIFAQAPDNVKIALAELNIAVHRCESVASGANPRHVVTYFGLPKTLTLDIEHYDYFTDIYEFGTIYLNYVEIGKTIADLTRDNDYYISDSAFQPFRFYSADFVVKFFNSDIESVKKFRNQVQEYYLKNKKFFTQKGLDQMHPYLKFGAIPLAKLETNLSEAEILTQVSQHQFVKSVTLK